jgi:upstream activation factor subunit UAF30
MSFFSPPLANLVDVPKLSRPQVVKKIWEHIKANNLQDPTNRKEIVCDDMLRAIFNVDRIDMFQMNKALGK